MSTHDQRQQQRDPAATPIIRRDAERKTTDEAITEQEREWCRLAGFNRAEWQRLVFTRWRYRQGELTEYPEGR
ncbi:MAG: hypothetical protein M3Q65_09475 [Chloroflexota bacterium]|nr:hypothetical protein [Chloroflexota bacterium]